MKNKGKTKTKEEIEAARQRSNANLRPSTPGHTNNPNGRPKSAKLIGDEIRKILGDECDIKTEHGKIRFPGKKNFEVFADTLIKHALKGNPTAIREILDRVDGKVPLPIKNADDENGEEIPFKIIMDLTPEQRASRLKRLLARRKGNE